MGLAETNPLQVFAFIFHPFFDFTPFFKIGNGTDIVLKTAVPANGNIPFSREVHTDRRVIPEIRAEFDAAAAAAARE